MHSKDRPVRIVIVDEQPIFRDGLRLLLESEPGLLVVGETSNGDAALAAVRDLTPDVLLLGFAPVDRPPLETLQAVLASGIQVHTILLPSCVDTPDVLRAVALGVRGVVPKDSAADVLFKSIQAVMAGQYWIGGAGVSTGVPAGREFEPAWRRSETFGLTRRELDIVRAVVAGYTNAEIGERFTISETTVKRRLTRIFNKLGASNRVELALFAAHHRLLKET